MTTLVALDVGGTTMKGAVAHPDGTLEEIERRPTDRADPAAGPLAFVDAPPLRTAQLGGDAGCRGAALLAAEAAP